ncbi:MAG: PKD domain-containing protein [Bacteroidales bacterium]|nr:PKD domain-containing protein [Bacteroidales bacterium]
MKPIRKLLLTLMMVLLGFMLTFAQQPFVVLSGHVLNQQTGLPVAGQPVFIALDSLNYPGYTNEVYTNEAGFYTDNVPFSSGVPGFINVSTPDCNGAMAMQTVCIVPGIQELTLDFTICSQTTSGCVALFSFIPTSDDRMTIAFTDESFTSPGSTISGWFWDFGDGITSTQQNPVHTYQQPGFYNACLYISSNDSSCFGNLCLMVDAGNVLPGGCDNYFSYYPDSSGTAMTYVFEGYTMNGEADSWNWDFGDGTTASGQTVTHVFQDPSMFYTVCLTTTGTVNGEPCTGISCQEIFNYVPSPCESFFWYQPDSTGTGYQFEGWSMGTAQMDSWHWDFGDGSTAEGQIVNHVFADPNQVYNVCLTTTGADPTGGTCTYTSCQEVYYYVPSPCESSFWYYPNAGGNSFTFEGWSFNNQVDSWTWEFGDGTTATGQMVTHTFENPGEFFTVCLTTTGTGADSTACSFVSCQEVYIYIPSPCENYFEYTSNEANTFFFTGHLMSNEPASYFWDFGDGFTATGQQVSHTYPPSWGMVYNVCLTTVTTNPADSCMSTSCQAVFPGGGGGDCQAVMSASPDPSGYTYFFADLSQGDHNIRFWDFGDGEQSSEANPVHTYNAAGIYLACLTIGDSLSNCWDQTCQEIWVDVVQPECQASFFAFPADSTTSPLSYQFINTSTPGFTNQQWSFGDGTASLDVNPVHTYAVPGTYEVCLTIWDSTGYCQNTYCMPVFAGDAPAGYNVAGVVIAGNAPAEQGVVLLFGADNTFSGIATIDSMGIYNIGGVPAGSYYIYAMLTPGSAGSELYLPTYYTSSLTWQGATLVTAGEPNGWYPITMVSAVYAGQGNGTITGTITYSGSFKSGGAPAANVEIVLFNSTGIPIAYTFSHEDGSFAFENLPYGEYTVHAEMAGKTTHAMVLTLSDSSATPSVGFVITATEINATALGQNDLSLDELEAGNVYPNPVGDMLYLELNSSVSGSVTVEITDQLGRVLKQERISQSGGDNRISIATSGLTKGIYLIRISSEGYQPLQRKFIK